jgi:hypothetical protein
MKTTQQFSRLLYRLLLLFANVQLPGVAICHNKFRFPWAKGKKLCGECGRVFLYDVEGGGG